MTAAPDAFASVFDADTHLYEPDDCFSRHLPLAYRERTVHVSDRGGSRAWWFGKRKFRFVPDAIDHAHRPGDGVHFFDDADAMVRESTNQPAYRDRADRLRTMDQHGVHRALIYPNVGLVAEFEMRDDLDALCANLTSYNHWLNEEWGFRYNDRLFAVPVITLENIGWATAELGRLVASGARMVLLRAGPTANGRSPAHPSNDGFWSLAAREGIPVAFHITQSGYTSWFGARWGEDPEPPDTALSPFQVFTCFGARPMQDMFVNLLVNGLFTRFPELRVVSVENGTSWVPPILELESLMASSRVDPRVHTRSVTQVLRRNLYLVPGPYEDPRLAIDMLGADHVLFGSDFPHPEGLSLPLDYRRLVAGLPEKDQRGIMGGNAEALLIGTS